MNRPEQSSHPLAEPRNPPPNRIRDGSRFSLAERDARWAETRDLMRGLGIDCLVVFHASKESYHRYAWWLAMTGFLVPGAVVLPLEGEPTVFGAPAWPGRWIEDSSPVDIPLGEAIVSRLRAAGAKSIGFVGAEAGVFGLNEFYAQGLASYATVKAIKDAFPDASYKDVTSRLAELMLAGSPDMRKFCREAAEKGEDLQRSVLGMLGAGVTNRRIRAHIAQHTIMNDLVADVEVIEMPERPLKEGDVFNMENGLHYLGGYTQVTLAAAIGKISPEFEAMNDTARSVLEIAMAETRAGRRFGEVVEPLTDRIRDAGYWHFFPLIHSLNPITLVGPIGRDGGARYDATRGAGVVLRAGMLLSFEIAARKGPRDMIKIGGIGEVTETGVDMYCGLGLGLQRV